MIDPSITKALAEVLEPRPGSSVPIPQVHGAVLANLGIDRGVSFRDVKNALRAAGVSVRVDERGGEHFARDVVLGPDVPVRDPGLEKKIRTMRRNAR
ncbi:hypothetical protein ACF07B_15485 [Streptomyces sp. NPDC015532]|uniref:hypothetical protein n=1 Tax=Streptomyces sp. NPDC015532 TaxID=3364960 RepID=UPI0036FCD769